MNDSIITFPSSLFFFEDSVGCAYASELGHRHLQSLNVSDYGFSILSKRTGRIATFRIKMVNCDEDDDIVNWEFLPDGYSCDHIPNCEGVKIFVFNG